MNKVASNKLRYINFFCTILIILTHCNIAEFYTNNAISQSIVDYLSNLAIIAMPCFFFMSSYFFFRGYNTEMFKGKIKKRIYTLILPYFLWNLLGYIGLVIIGKESIGIESFLKAFIFIYFPTTDQMLVCANTPLWYIIRIMSYMILAPLIYRICKNKKIFYIILPISIAVDLIYQANYYSFIHWLPIFLTGAFVGLNYSKIFEKVLSKEPNNKNVSFIGVGIFVVITLIFDFLYKHYDSYYLRYVVRIISVFIVFACSCTIRIQGKKIGKFIIQSPFYFYCAHILVISVVKQLLLKINIFSDKLLLYMTLVIITICILYISFKILKKFIPGIFNILTGNRSNTAEVKNN